jgi:hypothetical protein
MLCASLLCELRCDAVENVKKIIKLFGTRQYFLIDSASSRSADLLSKKTLFLEFIHSAVRAEQLCL